MDLRCLVVHHIQDQCSHARWVVLPAAHWCFPREPQGGQYVLLYTRSDANRESWQMPEATQDVVWPRRRFMSCCAPDPVPHFIAKPSRFKHYSAERDNASMERNSCSDGGGSFALRNPPAHG